MKSSYSPNETKISDSCSTLIYSFVEKKDAEGLLKFLRHSPLLDKVRDDKLKPDYEILDEAVFSVLGSFASTGNLDAFEFFFELIKTESQKKSCHLLNRYQERDVFGRRWQGALHECLKKAAQGDRSELIEYLLKKIKKHKWDDIFSDSLAEVVLGATEGDHPHLMEDYLKKYADGLGESLTRFYDVSKVCANVIAIATTGSKFNILCHVLSSPLFLDDFLEKDSRDRMPSNSPTFLTDNRLVQKTASKIYKLFQGSKQEKMASYLPRVLSRFPNSFFDEAIFDTFYQHDKRTNKEKDQEKLLIEKEVKTTHGCFTPSEYIASQCYLISIRRLSLIFPPEINAIVMTYLTPLFGGSLAVVLPPTEKQIKEIKSVLDQTRKSIERITEISKEDDFVGKQVVSWSTRYAKDFMSRQYEIEKICSGQEGSPLVSKQVKPILLMSKELVQAVRKSEGYNKILLIHGLFTPSCEGYLDRRKDKKLIDEKKSLAP